MDKLRPNDISSSVNFSFPVHIPPEKCRKIPEDDDQFEFGCLTGPDSRNSPADHLFLNGRLLPHVFPVHTHSTNHGLPSFPRSTSRAGGISRDSLTTSSRSNSTNSRGSNCSSARTSTSESSSPFSSCTSERGLSSSRVRAEKKTSPVYDGDGGRAALNLSRRWQLIAAAPDLSRGGLRRPPRLVAEALDRRLAHEKAAAGGKASWFGRRVLKLLVSACKECHAIKT